LEPVHWLGRGLTDWGAAAACERDSDDEAGGDQRQSQQRQQHLHVHGVLSGLPGGGPLVKVRFPALAGWSCVLCLRVDRPHRLALRLVSRATYATVGL
jgi:hypothetical protein